MTPRIELVIAVAALALAFVVLAVTVFGGWFVVRQIDHRRRIERRQAGLSEVPADQRKEKPREPIPENVRELIEPFHSIEARAGVEADCYALHARGVPWKEIKRLLQQQLLED